MLLIRTADSNNWRCIRNKINRPYIRRPHKKAKTKNLDDQFSFPHFKAWPVPTKNEINPIQSCQIQFRQKRPIIFFKQYYTTI